MSYRTFTDSEGTHWQVWDVRPEEAERRLRERRKLHDPPEEELRGVFDRRRKHGARGDLPPELIRGWLVFQSDGMRKRFWPIPDGWHALAVAELRDLCKRATTVSHRPAGRGRDASGQTDTVS